MQLNKNYEYNAVRLIAWQIDTESTAEREFGALEKINDNYPKFLLTTESFTQDRSGIKHLNVFNWLLKNN